MPGLEREESHGQHSRSIHPSRTAERASPVGFQGDELAKWAGAGHCRRRGCDRARHMSGSTVSEDAEAERAAHGSRFNMSMRKFLKQVGITSQREIERVVREQSGVEGVYNRHDYFEEMADALLRLETKIKSILEPLPANVVPLQRSAEA
jgi:hypothetical protein